MSTTQCINKAICLTVEFIFSTGETKKKNSFLCHLSVQKTTPLNYTKVAFMSGVVALLVADIL